MSIADGSEPRGRVVFLMNYGGVRVIVRSELRGLWFQDALKYEVASGDITKIEVDYDTFLALRKSIVEEDVDVVWAQDTSFPYVWRRTPEIT